MAVQNMPLISVHKTILDPRTTKEATLPEAQIESATCFFGGILDLNESQAKAVVTVLLNPNPFTLIQGPPGTGKTKAIEGLLGAIFSGPVHGNPISVRYPRVPICAPSMQLLMKLFVELRMVFEVVVEIKFISKS